MTRLMPSASRPLRNNSAETEAPTASVRSTFDARDGLFQRGADPGDRLLHRRLGGLGAEADQHLGRVAELLHALLRDVLGGQRGADLGEIGRAWRAHLHHDAAGEVDAEVEARIEEQHDRRGGQDRGHDRGP